MRATREHVRTVVIASVCLLVGLTAPAAASQLRATFADNSDKVDGFHAVGAGATIAHGLGMLVAPCPTTGRLPNNIIGTAPNAKKFGGRTPAQLRFLPVSIPSGTLSDGATESFGAAELPATGGSWAYSFLLPPDHPKAAPITLQLIYSVEGAGACAWHAQTIGSVGSAGVHGSPSPSTASSTRV